LQWSARGERLEAASACPTVASSNNFDSARSICSTAGSVEIVAERVGDDVLPDRDQLAPQMEVVDGAAT